MAVTRRESAAFIRRPAVAQRVADALRAGSLLVIAEAGAGKTIALEQGIAASGLQAAWMRCGEAEREPGRLLVHVVESLREALPGVSDVVRAQITSGAAPVDVDVAASTLVDELGRLLAEPLVLAIDDAERLRGASSALALVQRLVAAGGRLRVAVASRIDLGLGTPRLRADGQLAELDSAALAFDAVDCAAVLEGRLGRPPDSREIEEVMRVTEGWPLGVALGGMAHRDAELASVADEVLGPLDADTRRLVVDAALPRELDAHLADELGLPAGFLESPDAGALFLRRDGAGWYRFHPLLREQLRARFDAERSPDEAAWRHGVVAQALEDGGRGEEAIDHWLAAGRAERAATLLAREGRRLLAASPRSVAAWLDALPAQVRAHPAMALIDSRLAYGAGRHPEAIELARAAVAGFAAAGATEGEWMARLALVDAMHAHGDLAGTLEVVRGFDEGEARESEHAPSVAVIASMCASHVGRLDECAELRERMLRHPRAAGTRAIDPALEGFFLDRPAGRLDAALRRGRAAVAALEQEDPFGRLPYVRALLHNLLEDFGYDEEAVAVSRRAEQDGRELGVAGYVGPLLRQHRAGILVRLGRLAEAQAELDWVGDRRGGGWRRTEVSVALLAAARGEHAAAAESAEATLAEVRGGPLVRWSHAVCFTVPVLVACGRPGRAREALDELLAGWIDGYDASRPLALRAWLRHGEGDAGAWHDLRAAWDAAGDQVRHLVRREWARLEALLRDALTEGALESGAVVHAIEGAWPGGAQLLPLLEHPRPEVRRAALRAAASSGRPEVAERLGRLTTDPDQDVASAARRAIERRRADPLPLVFRTLGGFELRRGSWLVDPRSWERPAAQRLVRLLVVRREGAAEAELFDAFWPGRAEPAARRSLQVAVSRARAVLDAAGGEGSAIEALPGGGYRLSLRESDLVDADEFEVAAERALRATGAERRPALRSAAARWGGTPLPDERWEAWSAAWRERLEERMGRVLGALTVASREDGDHAAAAEAARRHLELDPLNENAHHELMLAYARTGRRAHALRQFLACRRALVDELGVEPSERMRELQARVLAGEPV